MTTTQAIGRIIRSRRLKLGVSKKALAAKSGVHSVTIANLEMGTMNNTCVQTVEKLAKALNISTADLFISATGEEVRREENRG